MNQQIDDFLKCKKLAFVGLSRSGKKFGNTIYSELAKRGYELYPLHKEEKEINGVICYPDLTSIKDKIEGVLINTSPKNVIPILEEAAALGIKNIWLQSGAESTEVYETAQRLNLPIVTKNCMLLHAEPVKGFHKFHRVIAKLFGKL
jgi:uncharacterized protein